MIKSVIKLGVWSKSTSNVGRIQSFLGPGLLASKHKHHQDFQQRELSHKIDLRRKLERAKNAGLNQQAKRVLDANIKHLENKIGFLQKGV